MSDEYCRTEPRRQDIFDRDCSACRTLHQEILRAEIRSADGANEIVIWRLGKGRWVAIPSRDSPDDAVEAKHHVDFIQGLPYLLMPVVIELADGKVVKVVDHGQVQTKRIGN